MNKGQTRGIIEVILTFITEQMLNKFNPLTARIFTVFGQFIRGQSVTQRSMGRDAPRYSPQYPGPKNGQIFKNRYLVLGS